MLDKRRQSNTMMDWAWTFADMKGIFLDFVEALDLYCTSEDLFYD